MEGLSYLAFAAAYRRVGAVYMDGDEILYWKMSGKAYSDLTYAADFVRQLIEEFAPSVVITETLFNAQRKGKHTRQVIATLAKTAENAPVLDMNIARQHSYRNKYEEADALIGLYPIMAPLRPKVRKYFDNEPRSTVLFEALSLAESVKRGPTTLLAAAMG